MAHPGGPRRPGNSSQPAMCSMRDRLMPSSGDCSDSSGPTSLWGLCRLPRVPIVAPSIRSSINRCADFVDRLAEAFQPDRASSDGWLGSGEWVELSARHIDDMSMMLEAENFDAGEMQAVWQRLRGTTPQDQQWSMGLCIPRFKPPVSWMIAERRPNIRSRSWGCSHKRFRRSDCNRSCWTLNTVGTLA